MTHCQLRRQDIGCNSLVDVVSSVESRRRGKNDTHDSLQVFFALKQQQPTAAKKGMSVCTEAIIKATADQPSSTSTTSTTAKEN